MYCQNCGNELTRQNLAFCNRCGERINLELERFQGAPVKSATAGIVRTLSVATGFVSFSGVIAIAIIINQLIFRGDIQFAAFMLVMVFSALIFGIIFLLVNQISRLSSSPDFARFTQKKPLELLSNEANNQLPPQFQTIPSSVTEYTTRNLESLPRQDG